MSFSFCFSPMRRATLFALDSSFLAVVAFVAGNAFSFLVFVVLAAGNAFSFLALWYSVPERASYGTEYAFGAQNRLLGYATHFQRHSVQKTGFYGTEGIFGAQNSLLWYAAHHGYSVQPPSLVRNRTRRTGNGFLWPSYATETTGQSSFSAWLSQIPHNSHPLIRRQCDNT